MEFSHVLSLIHCCCLLHSLDCLKTALYRAEGVKEPAAQRFEKWKNVWRGGGGVAHRRNILKGADVCASAELGFQLWELQQIGPSALRPEEVVMWFMHIVIVLSPSQYS